MEPRGFSSHSCGFHWPPVDQDVKQHTAWSSHRWVYEVRSWPSLALTIETGTLKFDWIRSRYRISTQLAFQEGGLTRSIQSLSGTSFPPHRHINTHWLALILTQYIQTRTWANKTSETHCTTNNHFPNLFEPRIWRTRHCVLVSGCKSYEHSITPKSRYKAPGLWRLY